MKLQTIFDQLVHGELAHLFIGGSETDNIIIPENYPKVVTYINMALLELYKRFPIHVAQVDVQQYESIGTYVMAYDYAISNATSTQPTKYIQDSLTNPFKDSAFLKIENIFDENGCELILNNSVEAKSYFTPHYNQIQVPNPSDDVMFSVMYRASHASLAASSDIDPEVVEVSLPFSLLLPLCSFVGARAFAGTSTLNGVDDSQRMMQQYELACARITEYDLLNYDITPNYKAVNNGWA